MTTKLPMHEWCIVLLFCLVLLTLASFAFGWPKSSAISASSLPSEPQITALQVKIEGQVAKPGLYRLPLHATLKHLLEQAEPLPSADLSHLNWKRKLQNGQVFHIPERRLINIQVTGAVEQPGSLQILSGFRYSELIGQLSVLPEADLKALSKKKSFVQEGALIEVPFKKQTKKKKQKTKP